MYISKPNLKYLVCFIFLFLLKPIPEFDHFLLCLFFIYLFLIWFFCLFISTLIWYSMLKQYLREKCPWILFLKTTQGSFLWTPLTLFVLYYFLSTLWEFLYCCVKLQDTETLLRISLASRCSSLPPFVLALNLQIWLCVYCNNSFVCIYYAFGLSAKKLIPLILRLNLQHIK